MIKGGSLLPTNAAWRTKESALHEVMNLILKSESKGKTTLEILSLSVSNTLAAFSFLVALAPMILSSFANGVPTMRVSKEEGDDDGDDDEDDYV
jgi:hypothetical protein